MPVILRRMEMNLSRAYALEADAKDPLADYRNQFLLPRHHNEPVAYFCGNSLGLQPIQTARYLKEELDQWAEHGVEGHFNGARPWFHYHKFLTEP